MSKNELPHIDRVVLNDAYRSLAIRDLMSRFDGSSALVAYFFCDFAAQQQQDIAAVLRSLLRQTVLSVEASVLPVLVQLQAKARQANDVRILTDMLKAICDESPNMFLIVDALDELQKPGPVMSLLKELAAKRAKVLITSREMGSCLDKQLDGAARVYIEAKSEDIQRFVEGKLMDAEVSRNIKGMRDFAVEVSNKANGM